MLNDRFTYYKGDIKIKKTQCDFCAFVQKDNQGNSKDSCSMYPDKIPENILNNLNRCESFKSSAGGNN